MDRSSCTTTIANVCISTRRSPRARYPEIDAKSRALIEAFQAGVKQYMVEHPSEVPAWAPQLEPWMCVALGRYIIWGWPEGEAADDLERIGIKPDPVDYHGSNEWLVAPKRTAYNAPIALIDPHLELVRRLPLLRSPPVRRRAGVLRHGHSRAAPAGARPQPLLLDRHDHRRARHFRRVRGGNQSRKPRQYRYDGAWVDMTVRPEVIKVKEADGVKEKTVEIEYTRHGPIVARKDGKAYTFRIPYFDQVGLMDQTTRWPSPKTCPR